jgi:hypothetical protein
MHRMGAISVVSGGSVEIVDDCLNLAVGGSDHSQK